MDAMSVPEWYLALVEKHRALLLGDAKAIQHLHAWFQIFSRAAYTEAELAQAFAAMEADPHRPGWRKEQLAYIQRQIHRQRDASRRGGGESRDGPKCPLCNGMAVVSVPFRGDVRDGNWVAPFRRVTVACSCPAGERTAQWFREEVEPGRPRYTRPIMRLVDYEFRNPLWQEQLRYREEDARVEKQVLGLTEELDYRLGKIGRMPRKE
jgi:hypothetical protein